jgi:hypothetical protein
MTGTNTETAIDDALLSVWRPALVDQKKIIAVGDSEPPNIAWHRLILN